MNNNLNFEEIKERNRIAKLEEMDKNRYISEILEVTKAFNAHGISMDVSAQLAAQFYNDPEIRKRRGARKNKKV